MSVINVHPGPDALVRAVADEVTAHAQNAIAAQGRFTIGLSGGSTPRPLFRLLASEPYRSAIDWGLVWVLWGDERCVPPDDRDSNYGMARDLLLEHVTVPPSQVVRVQGELPPQQAAQAYENALRTLFDTDWPRIDYLLQGMGADGHTASLFPYTAALHEKTHWVVANYVEKMESWRITLSPPAINAARHITFMVAGESKAEAVKAVLEGPHQPDTYPSQMIQPVDGSLNWELDAAAARLLERQDRA